MGSGTVLVGRRSEPDGFYKGAAATGSVIPRYPSRALAHTTRVWMDELHNIVSTHKTY